ncbi:MAG TPA: hypothetical protein DCQ31_18560 [Bacteroidales bacterium]|nr:hypothetical protein [Bacteroidales bacterium]
MNSQLFNKIFKESIQDYYTSGELYPSGKIPYAEGSIEFLLFRKNRIDNIQWNLEDIIREETIEPAKAVKIKREIDVRNQERTDTVEQIDDMIFAEYKNVELVPGYRVNTESAAWVIDRLSILNIKLYHMQKESVREGASDTVKAKCLFKLGILNQQYSDLSFALDQLLSEIATGKCKVHTYKQMKMYNDPELNPFLRKN